MTIEKLTSTDSVNRKKMGGGFEQGGKLPREQTDKGLIRLTASGLPALKKESQAQTVVKIANKGKV